MACTDGDQIQREVSNRVIRAAFLIIYIELKQQCIFASKSFFNVNFKRQKELPLSFIVTSHCIIANFRFCCLKDPARNKIKKWTSKAQSSVTVFVFMFTTSTKEHFKSYAQLIVLNEQTKEMRLFFFLFPIHRNLATTLHASKSKEGQNLTWWCSLK